jgi:hypothetical protein
MGTTHTTQPVPTPATLLTSPSAFATVELAERISKFEGIRYSSQQGAWNDSGCSEYEEKITFQISKKRDQCIWTVRLINGKVQEWTRLAIWDGFIEDVQWNKGEYGYNAEQTLMQDMEAVNDEFTNLL